MKKITLSGDVGWEITARYVSEQLEEANGDDIEVSISSRGGLVGEALEIFNLFRNYTGKTTAILSGYAMSAGSYIPMSFDKVIVEDNAVMMIHNAQGIAWGDHNEMLHYGGVLKGLSSLLANAYTKFSGKLKAEVSAMMDSETWLYGQGIVDAGFAHEIISADDDGDQESATAMAKLKFSEIVAKMSGSKEIVITDLSKASAMAIGEANRATEPTNKKEEETMNLTELKGKHPDLVALIEDEAKAEMDGKITAAREDGATAERDRIKAVFEQSYPGHEGIVNAAMFDGKSQAGDVAMAINQANIKAQQNAATDMTSDAPEPVPEPANNDIVTGSGELTEENAKKKWNADANVRKEFGNFTTYFSYLELESGKNGGIQ